MDDSASAPTVRQLRLVVEAEDYDAAVNFYRDVLGLPEQAAFHGEGDAKVMILDAGRATLEIANPAQKRMIDAVEACGRPSVRIRVAFEVDDAVAATARACDGGADVTAEPTETPWRSLNARMNAPAGLQLTLFEELGPREASAETGTTDPRGTKAPEEEDRRHRPRTTE